MITTAACLLVAGFLILWRGRECCRHADDPLEDAAGLFIMALGAHTGPVCRGAGAGLCRVLPVYRKASPMSLDRRRFLATGAAAAVSPAIPIMPPAVVLAPFPANPEKMARALAYSMRVTEEIWAKSIFNEGFHA